MYRYIYIYIYVYALIIIIFKDSCVTIRFRWVCTSGLPSDLKITDNIAAEVMEDVIKEGGIANDYCQSRL